MVQASREPVCRVHDDCVYLLLSDEGSQSIHPGAVQGEATINVTDADGTDIDQQSPRFQVGHLLRIESEYLRVLALDTATNQLTVQRGVNGTTAASHAQSTQIDTFQPAQVATMLNLRWAAWLYREPDSAKFSAAPADLQRAAQALRRVRVSA